MVTYLPYLELSKQRNHPYSARSRIFDTVLVCYVGYVSVQYSTPLFIKVIYVECNQLRTLIARAIAGMTDVDPDGTTARLVETLGMLPPCDSNRAFD
jgi:hypothetical protein